MMIMMMIMMMIPDGVAADDDDHDVDANSGDQNLALSDQLLKQRIEIEIQICFNAFFPCNIQSQYINDYVE